jgi:hypothetical protein
LRRGGRSLRMMKTPCTLLIKIVRYIDFTESEELECEDPESGAIVALLNMPQWLRDKFENNEIHSGVDTLFSNGAAFSQDGTELILPKGGFVEIGKREDGGRRMAASTGVNNVLVVRANAIDDSTSANEAELSDSWFGTGNDLVNLKSQYSDCSFGQLTCNPFDGVTSNGTSVSKGAISVNIAMDVTAVADGIVRDAMRSAATNQLGDLPSQFDHVALCIPPGTSGRWIAYGYVNSWLTVFNDNWCTYVSAQMHEVRVSNGECVTVDDCKNKANHFIPCLAWSQYGPGSLWRGNIRLWRSERYGT